MTWERPDLDSERTCLTFGTPPICMLDGIGDLLLYINRGKARRFGQHHHLHIAHIRESVDGKPHPGNDAAPE